MHTWADVHMLLEGTIAELIIKLEPNYIGNKSGKTKAASPCYM